MTFTTTPPEVTPPFPPTPRFFSDRLKSNSARKVEQERSRVLLFSASFHFFPLPFFCGPRFEGTRKFSTPFLSLPFFFFPSSTARAFRRSRRIQLFFLPLLSFSFYVLLKISRRGSFFPLFPSSRVAMRALATLLFLLFPSFIPR